jgi:hypothetical protein
MTRHRFLVVGLVLAVVLLGLPPANPAAGEAQAQTPTRRPRPVTTVQPPPAFAPIMDVGTGCLLGGAAKGAFMPQEQAEALVKGGERYRMYSLSGYLGRGTGSTPDSLGEPCVDQVGVEITPDYVQRDPIAVAGNWPAMPRLPRAMSANSRVYRDATAALLKAMGIARPNVYVTQVLRVDLEGDRVDEVLVSATHYASGFEGGPSPNAEAGDYSIVFMRKVMGGIVETRVLAADVYSRAAEFVAPAEYKIKGVLDLNGDGTMEVVVYGRYYEGHWSTVYQVKGTQVEEVLTCGCGA